MNGLNNEVLMKNCGTGQIRKLDLEEKWECLCHKNALQTYEQKQKTDID